MIPDVRESESPPKGRMERKATKYGYLTNLAEVVIGCPALD